MTEVQKKRNKSFAEEVDSWLLDSRLENEQSIEATIRCPSSLALFEGHFPTQPVLPGALLLTALRLITELLLQTPLQPLELASVKFTAGVQPEEKINFRITLQREDTTLQLQFTASCRQTVVGQGCLHCTIET
jgi:3-hydroxymyristoyl/3-hydroxydecanoyl-(acyl carrier protein) dehydratase